MRVLHLGKYFPPAVGGMERFLGDLVGAQRAGGIAASAIVHDHHGKRLPDEPAWLMRCPVLFRLFFAPISPAFPLWLDRAISRFAPDVLHIHMPNLSAFWALLLPRARGLPWVVHWHSDVEPSRFRRSLRMLYPCYRVFESAVLEHADAIVATSPDYLAASHPLQRWREKCVVVPLGLDPSRLSDQDTAASSLWRDGTFRVLAIGRLSYYKGFETLIRAVARLDGGELIVVGDGEERNALERVLASEGSPSRIRLVGEVDDVTCQKLLASCDIFCLPSRERTEAFGIVLMEAMRYGRPLLVSRIPGSGVLWVVQDGQNGVHVPMEDPAAWRDALADLAARPERRRALGLAGRLRFEREFDIRHSAARMASIYRTVLRQDDVDVRPNRRALVVIPARNEVETIGGVIAAIRAHGIADVLVVDDGSQDGTGHAARAAGARVLRAPLPQGAWGAMQTGIRFAVRHGYSSVVTMDADGQHEPAYLEQLLLAGEAADVVIGACPERGSRLRHLAWAYFRLLTGFNIEDLTSGFRYYNSRACRLLADEEATLLDYQDIGVLLLLRKAGFVIREVPVEMNPRQVGASRIFDSWLTVARYMSETTLLCMARWKVRPRPD